jgi:hypothetical protein
MTDEDQISLAKTYTKAIFKNRKISETNFIKLFKEATNKDVSICLSKLKDKIFMTDENI